ncbi:putative transcription factor Trihelix family [Helianthus annuus]|nr:putative transcription factor Trihelix family [Helianthus annuus]KAJ0782464.1 putative transcription factor Trihelix family [Helianthus annuus]KAJ0808952.1 putative transcription factor Trihelix family [Helianthus annuus]
MADNSPSPASAHTPSSRPIPFREDCWSEDATATLVEAWGTRYVELNRGNLRQKDWQEVADAVNARHGHTKKTRRTDVQCKNRIDTLKKKYKVEKARVSESNGSVVSNWRFYSRLDTLIGAAGSSKKSSSSSPPTAVPLPYRKPPLTVMNSQFHQPLAILPQKRPLPVAAAVDESYFRRNYSAVAAAAAAAEEDGSEDEDSLASSEDEGAGRGKGVGNNGGGGVGDGGDTGGSDSMKRLAMAIERFGEIYERVEGEKQKQMIELEKQRMQFTKDLEVQRMQLFMDTQVQLEKIKQAKRTVSDDDVYS